MPNVSRALSLSQLAQEERRQGRSQEAIALWEEALGVDPGNTNHVIELTNYLTQIGRAEQALQVCENQLSGNQGVALLWMQKGIIQINHFGDTKGAIESFQCVLRHEPAYA
ncbi:MAG: hypothetical protein ABI171_20310 [Collimonas sp.]|uniref:hypothetical protein n=1 Tax=Collimonas sp. TaxID=1963772 RepID=UPI0032636C66